MQSDISDIWHSSNAQLFYDICNTYLRNMMTHKSTEWNWSDEQLS